MKPTIARIHQIDFLKAVMIILMVVFHLVWFSQGYPHAKLVVYTFHMPAFLLISGYFSRADKPLKQTLHKLLWLFTPYAIMETGYVFMCHLLPIGEHLDTFNVGVWAYHVFVHPLGPYWYLHTLILCQIIHCVVFHPRWRGSLVSKLIVFALAAYALHQVVVFIHAFYFLLGVLLHEGKIPFLKVFRPSWLALLPLVGLIYLDEDLNRATLAGVAVTYLAISLCLCIYPYLAKIRRLRSAFLTVGRNTLPILVFSPIFTLLAKPLIPWLDFDPTRLLFVCVAVGLNLGGCLGIAWLMDHLHVSRFFFGKSRILC